MQDVSLEIHRIKSLQARITGAKTSKTIYGWTPESVRAAVALQVRGDFSKTTQLAQSMLMDSAYSAALDKRVWSLLRSETILKPCYHSEYDKPVAELLASGLSSLWDETPNEVALQRFLKSYLQVGVGLAFIEWESYRGHWLPNLKTLSTESLKFDERTSHWQFTDSENKVHTVVPGDGNWVLLSNWELGEVTGFVSSLSQSWLMKQFAAKDWIDGNSDHVDPIAIISEAQSTPGNFSPASDQEDINSLVLEIQSQKKDRVLYLEQGKDIDFKSTNSTYNHSSFKDLIEYVDRKYQVAILGGNLSSEVTSSGGNRAASQTHAGIEREFALTDATMAASVLTHQVIYPMCKVNYSYEELSPELEWIIATGESEQEKIGVLTQALQLLKDHSPETKVTNLPDLLKRFGIEAE